MPTRVFAVLVLALSGCASLLPTETPRAVVRGPVAVTTNGPISGNFLQFRPRSVRTTAPGRPAHALANSYSSIFEDGHAGGNDVVLDGELWRTSLMARVGLTPAADVEVEIPFVYAGGGFLDGIVESWHALLGLPNGGREDRPDDAYEMRVVKNGREAFHLEGDALGLSDVPIVFTQRVVDEADGVPGVAVRLGVELPTGAESKGFGNGGFDWGGGASVERTLGRFTLTGGAYYVFVATPDSFRAAGLEAADQPYVHAGAEMRWNDHASVVLGLRWSGPTTRDVPIMEIDGNVLDLDVALSIDAGESARLAFGLTEDLVAESGPDFTVFATLSFGF